LVKDPKRKKAAKAAKAAALQMRSSITMLLTTISNAEQALQLRDARLDPIIVDTLPSLFGHIQPTSEQRACITAWYERACIGDVLYADNFAWSVTLCRESSEGDSIRRLSAVQPATQYVHVPHLSKAQLRAKRTQRG
jgi:hypothetical protein